MHANAARRWVKGAVVVERGPEEERKRAMVLERVQGTQRH
jgi:hypothetical protein